MITTVRRMVIIPVSQPHREMGSNPPRLIQRGFLETQELAPLRLGALGGLMDREQGQNGVGVNDGYGSGSCRGSS